MTSLSPSNALTPQVMLAMAVHAQPGVYAVVLGSGVSTGAGIPTGWGVVKDLVRRVAVAAAPQDAEMLEQAERDPQAWWNEHGAGELGYSTLLESVAPTAATRQGVLVGYFEPTDDERNEGIKTPSEAHRALAQLVKRGAVRVIVTTNFDRLTEQALEAAGVSPQVIARPGAVKGMAPLAHAQATVIKLHGDYLDLGSRNTPQELEDYPAEWNRLLDQVFDEYGLLISGWSADWDTALVAALERAPARRYPLYWDRRSSKGEAAQRVLRGRAGQVLDAASADDLFRELLVSVEALDRLAEPPLTTAMAVARLKRYLPDPVHRIDLHDLVFDATDRVVRYIHGQPLHLVNVDWAAVQVVYERYLEAATPLLRLVTVGVWHDHNDEHGQLWRDVLDRLVGASRLPDGVFDERLYAAQHYPALLALQSIGTAAVSRGHDALLLRLLTEIEWHDPYRGREVSVAHVLRPSRVLVGADALPRWTGQRWIFPLSRMLKEDLRPVLQDLIPNDGDYTTSVHSYEYRVGLVQERTRDTPGGRPAAGGEFACLEQWNSDGIPRTEVVFRKQAATAGRDWPWWSLLGGEANFESSVLAYRETLERHRNHW